MSQQPLSTGTAHRVTPRPPKQQRPPLRVVAPTRRRAGRIPFIVFCSILMTLGLAALLALNLSLVAGSYALHDVTAKVEALRAQEAELSEKVALRSTPSELATRAKELGMVTGGTPAYLRLGDGSVVGNPTPAPSASTGTGAAAADPTPEQDSTNASGTAPSDGNPSGQPTSGSTNEDSGVSAPAENPGDETGTNDTSAQTDATDVNSGQ